MENWDVLMPQMFSKYFSAAPQTAVHRAGRATGVPSEGVKGQQAAFYGERGAALEAP